jgi:hypothetical protein
MRVLRLIRLWYVICPYPVNFIRSVSMGQGRLPGQQDVKQCREDAALSKDSFFKRQKARRNGAISSA